LQERRLLAKTYKVAGVARIKPNEFGRHFIAAHAVSDLRAEILPVQAWLGHTDPRTTMRYARLRPISIPRILEPKAKVA
jgi:integrase